MSSPNDRTIDRRADKLKNDLFKHGQYYYHQKDVIKLLNKLGGYTEAPNEDKLLWGDCISTCINIKNMMKSLGVGGSDILQIVKQCIVACMLDIKDNEYERTKVGNKDLIKKTVPHTNDHCRNDWIDKCIERRKKYDLFGDPDDFIDAPKHKTPSYVHIFLTYL